MVCPAAAASPRSEIQSDVAWEVEQSCRSESKPYAGRGNGKYRKQQGGKHFDASKCEGWEKKKKKLTSNAQRGHHRRVVVHSHSSVRLDLSYRLYPDPFSNASNEYVARYARS